MGWLDGDLANMVNDIVSPILMLDVTLYRATQNTTGQGWRPSPGNIVEYACKGFISQYKENEINGDTVRTNDRKIMIMAKSISVQPQQGDKVKVSGDDREYTIVGNVTSDPARATYTMVGR